MEKLAAAGIRTPEQLLWCLPRTYEDRSQIKTIEELLTDGSVQTVRVKVVKKSMIVTPKRKKLVDIQLVDEHEHRAMARFLHVTSVMRTVMVDQRYYVIGKPEYAKGQWTYRHPELVPTDAPDGENGAVGGIYPIYPELQWITRHRFYKKIAGALPTLLSTVRDPLPADFLTKRDLVDLPTMFQSLHAPQDFEQIKKARTRIYTLKLLQRQLNALITKQMYQARLQESPPDREIVRDLLQHVPFALTWAQKRVVKEIIEEVHGPVTMMKLLQWDVWSGKTIVAAIVAWYILQKRWGQIVFLAPLAVLANQQFRSLAKLLLPLWIRVELLTWATKPSEKKRIKQALLLGQIQIIVGTHALLQDDIHFADLKLAVIDEQHKFGVKQRGFFQQFWSPHILQMTATPIPRSLALAFFGEFTVSAIDEMPAGRKPIITKIISESERHKLKPRILTKISQGQRVFVITPLIEESEFLDEVKSAFQQFEMMRGLFERELVQAKKDAWQEVTQCPVGLLHGKLKNDEKDAVMSAFKDGKIDMLVSTTVIEVGIDIPEATVMIIMNAERFGLSQLHQLRGRVGRNELQSYCFLETKNKSGETYQRLQHMETTNDGFKLAELDLQLRGAGEFLWTRQSGDTDLPIEILTDTSFIARVQEMSEDLMKNHPQVASGLLEGEGGPVLA